MRVTSASLKLTAVAIAALIAFFGLNNITPRNYHARANSSGPPASFTGAPDESSCIACHSDFPINSGGGNIRVTGLPAVYTPGAQYPVTVTVNHENGVVYGFQTTAINAQGQTAGTYTLPAQNPPQMQTVTGVIGTITRRYVQHTQAGILPTQFNTKSWTFNWTAPAQRSGGVVFYAAGNGANSDGSTSGDYIYTGFAATCSARTNANFDTDNKADIAVFRPSNGFWYRSNSTNNAFVATNFGQSGDRIMPGDYDGDGRFDFAVFRPANGAWYIRRSSDSQFQAINFGSNGDRPVPGDYDGDGRTDAAVFRPSNGTWYFQRTTAGFGAMQWGSPTDVPVPTDYDGDCKTDVAVFRDGNWFISQSSDGQFRATQFGSAGDIPIPSAYTAE